MYQTYTYVYQTILHVEAADIRDLKWNIYLTVTYGNYALDCNGDGAIVIHYVFIVNHNILSVDTTIVLI